MDTEEGDTVVVTGPVCKQGGVDGKEDGEGGAEGELVTLAVMAVARAGPPHIRVIKQEVAMEVLAVL